MDENFVKTYLEKVGLPQLIPQIETVRPLDLGSCLTSTSPLNESDLERLFVFDVPKLGPGFTCS